MHDGDAQTHSKPAVDWRLTEPCGRIARADWLEGVRTLPQQSVDLMYVDPPFMTGTAQTGPSGTFDDRWADMNEYLSWMRIRLEASIPAIRSTGSLLLHVDWRTSHRVRVMLDELLGESCFVNHLVWAYGLGGSSPRRFARKHDDILFYAISPERYWFEPPRVPATSRRMAGQSKKATDVLLVPSINNMARERTGWPTQKPLALLRLLVGACCPPGGVVLDPCCGSGTTLVSAKQLGRSFVGLDVNDQALAIAIERVQSCSVLEEAACGE